MKTKLRKNSSKRICPFGGVNFAIDAIKKANIPELIHKHLGDRPKQSLYTYGDVLLGWCYSNLCGAERLEDVTMLRDHFHDMPDMKLPSADRISGVIRSMSLPSKKYHVVANHEINVHKPLNRLMIDTALSLNLLNSSVDDYTLDYDNVVIETEKCDSEYTYKGYRGYSPGVSFIGKVPVYVEGRNGNVPAAFMLREAVLQSLELLEERNIRVKRFRSDAAAYSHKLMHDLNKKSIEFFIRAKNTNEMYFEAFKMGTWKKIEIGTEEYEACSINHYLEDYKESFRIVLARNTRITREEKHKYAGDNFVYRGIITNNTTMSDEEVIQFYNQRGAIERNFDALLNDFNWRRLPFSYLNENTVFMILGAISSILYTYLIDKFSKAVPFVGKHFRLKRFIFQFISVAAAWFRKGDTWILELFTDRNYEVLME